MSDRRGEKFGWFGGFLGGFPAALIMSVIMLFRGKILAGSIGLLLCVIASGAAWYFAPWRHPRTPYWRLFVPLYVLISGAVGWAVWALGAREAGFSGWAAIFPLAIVLLPIWTTGRQRWVDRETHQPNGGSQPVK